MKIFPVVFLFFFGVHAVDAQTKGKHAANAQTKTTYTDSLLAWRKNYVGTHEVVKTPEDRALLRFYPPDASYRVRCTVEKYADSPWFAMPTSSAVVKNARKYARLTFTLHDTVLHLVVYQMQSLLAKEETRNYLFIGFTDVTSAVDTYGAGRYIDCQTTDIHNGKLLLDFNKAYNPYCAYTTGYNCPIPPKENDMPVAILAGEKNYEKPH